MYRTPEEEREYQALSYKDKQRYDFEQSQDPELSHKTIMKLVFFKTDDFVRTIVSQGGKNGTIGTTEQKTILERLNNWLFKNAYSVWQTVRDTIQSAINYLGNLIERGLELFFDSIADFFDDIFG